MLLSYLELVELVESGIITADPKNINGASIDVRLDKEILVEKSYFGNRIIDLSNKESPEMLPCLISENGFLLNPGQCILGSTMEMFNLPNNISCEFKLKSSAARCFLNNMLATWCDPGWHGSKLTLELKNDCEHHALLLRPGMKIGQIIFYRVHPVPDEHSYAVKGRYNLTDTVTASKGV